MDNNTYKYAESVAVIGQATQYPITLAFSALATLFGVKHLNMLRKSTSSKDILNNSLKYIGTIIGLTTPSIIINNKIIQEQKKASQMSDMFTIKDMGNYKFFADYSRYRDDV